MPPNKKWDINANYACLVLNALWTYRIKYGRINMAIIFGRIQMKESTAFGVSYAIISAVIQRFSTAKPGYEEKYRKILGSLKIEELCYSVRTMGKDERLVSCCNLRLTIIINLI